MRSLPLLLAAVSVVAADFPEAKISNGKVTAKFHLPDAERGYYRGTRFDWSGQIYSLQAAGHEYFGQWFERYDAKLHDAIMGPVEEFDALGYDDAMAGGTFIRIGVGVVRKPEETAYQRFRTYEIVDAGKWSTRQGADWIEFTHDLNDGNSYAYRYTKKLRLEKGKAGMVIEHALKNTGRKRIAAWQYNHNFFVIDGQPTGPNTSVRFAFEPKSTTPFRGAALAEMRGREVVYLKELAKGESTHGEFDGFGKTASDYDVVVENRAAGAGVRITGDRPLSKLVYWSIRTTSCPEAYIDLAVEPGGETKWTYTYRFYELKR